MNRWIIIVLLWIGIAEAVYAQSNARNYQDCILEANRNALALDKRSIGRIKQTCLERFPETAPTISDKKLNKSQLDKVDLWVRRTSENNIEGGFYNGNPDIVVTQVTLLLTPRNTNDPVQDLFDSEEYEIDLRISPYNNGNFTILEKDTTIKGEFRWSIVNAWGY
jgi:hypothetical protein